MLKTALLPRKTPRQSRAVVTVDIILQAATRILSRESLAGFNTNRVAEVAGISTGSLYQYFPNKSALIAALIQREQVALLDAITACVETHKQAQKSKTFSKTLGAIVDIAIEHQFGNALYAAALDHEEKRLPLDEMLFDAQRRIVAVVESLLRRHHIAVSGITRARAANDCLIITKALIDSAAFEPQSDLRALKRRVLRALHGYLRIPGE
jgi:AcrR family transcriptional regulator